MKIKRYDITLEFLKCILSGERVDIQTIRNPIPADAELVRVLTNQNLSSPRIISLFLTSASFPDLPEGTCLQAEGITLITYHKEES